MDWQSYMAPAIVVITLVVFAIRLRRRGKSGGCGHDCGCGKKPR